MLRIISKAPVDGAVIPGLSAFRLLLVAWLESWTERAPGEGRVVKSCFASTPEPFGETACGERDHLPLLNIPVAIQCWRRGLISLRIPWLWVLVEKRLQHHPPSLAVGAELVQPGLALPLTWLFDFPVAG